MRNNSLRGGWDGLGVLVVRDFLVHQVRHQILEGPEIPAGFMVEDEIIPTSLAAILILTLSIVSSSGQNWSVYTK